MLHQSQHCHEGEKLLCLIAAIILPAETIPLGSSYYGFPIPPQKKTNYSADVLVLYYL